MIDHALLDRSAELYTELRASSQWNEDADLRIAAIGLVHGMPLVTHTRLWPIRLLSQPGHILASSGQTS
jgi:predicted nucleic acid-binding protein